ILYQKRIVLLFSLLLHMKVIVLHIRSYSLTLHQFIVLFTSITCISHHFFTLGLVPGFEAFQMGFQRNCVSSCLMDTILGDELIFCTDLGEVGDTVCPSFS